MDNLGVFMNVMTDFGFKRMFGLSRKLIHDFRFMEKDTHEIFSNILRLIFCNLAEMNYFCI